MNSIYKKPTSLALGAMLIFVCILFKPVIFGGKTFGSPDSLSPQAVGIALNEIQKETGNYPLWQPWVFSGMPTAEAFTNLSKLYFPEYLFKLFFLPGMLIQLAHLIFAGLGCFFLLKHFKCSPWSSLLGAVGYILTPYMVTMVVFGHGSQMMTAAYIPWVMWLTIRLWEKPTVHDAGWLAIILGFQLQRAHAQIAYYTWMLMGAYVLLQLIIKLKVKKSRGSVLKSCGLFTAAIFVGIGIALLVYLPSLEYTPFSVRGGGIGGGADYSYATGWSFHPKEILTFLIPSAFGFGGQTYWGFMPFTDYPNYMGVIILSLAILGLFNRRDSFRWFLVGTSVLALFISFGKYFSPIYDLFFNLLPFFNKFRVPHMILILLQFNIAMLAAFGLDGIMFLKEKKVPHWFWGLAGLTVLGMVVLSLGGTGLESWLKTKFTIPSVQDVRSVRIINTLRWDLSIADAWLAIGFLGGLIIFIWLRIQRKIGKKLLAIAVVAMAVVDIGIVDHKIINPGSKSVRGSQLIS